MLSVFEYWECEIRPLSDCLRLHLVAPVAHSSSQYGVTTRTEYINVCGRGRFHTIGRQSLEGKNIQNAVKFRVGMWRKKIMADDVVVAVLVRCPVLNSRHQFIINESQISNPHLLKFVLHFYGNVREITCINFIPEIGEYLQCG